MCSSTLLCCAACVCRLCPVLPRYVPSTPRVSGLCCHVLLRVSPRCGLSVCLSSACVPAVTARCCVALPRVTCVLLCRVSLHTVLLFGDVLLCCVWLTPLCCVVLSLTIYLPTVLTIISLSQTWSCTSRGMCLAPSCFRLMLLQQRPESPSVCHMLVWGALSVVFAPRRRGRALIQSLRVS